jgi:hypothetical protein
MVRERVVRGVIDAHRGLDETSGVTHAAKEKPSA